MASLPLSMVIYISNCPKLRELPQDGLPPSLEQLWILGCGKLEEQCKKGTGCYWPLIRHPACPIERYSPTRVNYLRKRGIRTLNILRMGRG
ncbi:LOW QUALITY PROTEIN: hypothetical protein BT93_B1698 [Corymbia citriodora subsp. variegata]|nr:LOW QUALITY PROTEIN: hypothetical protein BT93_B1698 [Corymbia citriodora subsp. variegata]